MVFLIKGYEQILRYTVSGNPYISEKRKVR
ncbi:hypothetical protein SAMN04488114_103152 [Carnobacterium iners]|nr:hypothetical protein SAMN04488114_103152 [Carnobacterium iners]